MKLRSLAPLLGPILLLAPNSDAAVSTGSPFGGSPPTDNRPWAIHDRHRPQPKAVEPGTPSTATQPGKPPSDAIVLFDGTEASLAKWEMEPKAGAAPTPAKWIIKDGALECVPQTGVIRTKEQFGDCQLHLEWAAPREVKGDSQGRGNSGIFLMGICEVQVLDSYNNPTYADGSANSIYAINPPMVNALRPPGEFQSIDIVFRRPIFRNGKMVEAGRVTVFCNGVVVQDSTPILGENYNQLGWKDKVYPEAGPLKFQDHGNPVRFRNIWYRPLAPRPLDGGFDGDLTAEATTAKRREIAASLRAEAAKLPAGSTQAMLRLAESLVYEQEAATSQQVETLTAHYAANMKKLPAAEIEAKKGEITSVTRALQYLARFDLVPKNSPTITALTGIATTQGWDQKKK